MLNWQPESQQEYMSKTSSNRKRVSFRVLKAVYEVLTEDMKAKGYVSGNGHMWGEYLGAIAAQVMQGKINLPKRVDT